LSELGKRERLGGRGREKGSKEWRRRVKERERGSE
jgi:hypothetical protein